MAGYPVTIPNQDSADIHTTYNNVLIPNIYEARINVSSDVFFRGVLGLNISPLLTCDTTRAIIILNNWTI